jgi:pimeloyl-ACP methyl ester carboxylesterase
MAPPSILLIPGASGLPEFYDKTVQPLREHGIDIKALHMPSVGLKSGPRPGKAPGMYEDAAYIAEHITALVNAGKDVIVFTHSYGGTPGTESIRGLSKKERQAEGKQGGVVAMAYMTSLVPNVGENAQSVVASKKTNRIPMPADVSLPRSAR